MAEVVELVEAAEAKAYYGLSINWKPLNALVDALLDRGVLQVGNERRANICRHNFARATATNF